MKLLSIDDDYAYQRLVSRFFTMMGGHRVEVAYSGEDGIDKAAKLEPDAILLDLTLPDMDGERVLELLAAGQYTRDIPVVIVSGRTLEPGIAERLRLHRNCRFTEQKPFSFRLLLERLTSLAENCGPGGQRPPALSGDMLPQPQD